MEKWAKEWQKIRVESKKKVLHKTFVWTFFGAFWKLIKSGALRYFINETDKMFLGINGARFGL